MSLKKMLNELIIYLKLFWYYLIDCESLSTVESSHCGAVETHLASIHEDAGRSLASLGGSGMQRCPELWCRLQMQLRSHIALAVV